MAWHGVLNSASGPDTVAMVEDILASNGVSLVQRLHHGDIKVDVSAVSDGGRTPRIARESTGFRSPC